MPKRTLGEYWRALLISLRMTVRGEKPASLLAEAQHEPLLGWCRETLARVKAVEAAAAAAGLPLAGIVLHLDGRDQSLVQVLDVVRFHAAQEIPHVVRQATPYTRPAVQAANLSDRYAVLRFSQHEPLPAAVRAALEQLGAHLGALPAA